MRTTVEITPEQRAQLLALAARRGEKGFSKLVQEALDAYLEAQLEDEQKRQRAVRLRGTFTDRDAESVREATRELRNSWR